MDTRKRKILLVEDDTALASVYRSRLELEGFDVCEANNGEDALSLAVSEHPDLILLDVMMPKLAVLMFWIFCVIRRRLLTSE